MLPPTFPSTSLSKYPEISLKTTPFNYVFCLFQYNSTFWVCTPVVGLTNSIELFTVSCWATLGKELMVLYAAHSSDHTIVPGATYCCIIGSTSPLIWPHCSAWCHILLYYWQQCCSGTVWYCTNNAQSWYGWCVNHSKYPVWICWASTTMVLWRRSYACTTGKMKLHTYY